MKSKKLGKKLSLNKTTMANLDIDQMNGANVKGGTGVSNWVTWCSFCFTELIDCDTAGTCYPEYTCPCYTLPKTDCAVQCEP